MGNRGKGKKGGKKGSKGKKGAKSSNKWGDEGTAQEDNRRVKKKPCLTQVKKTSIDTSRAAYNVACAPTPGREA